MLSPVAGFHQNTLVEPDSTNCTQGVTNLGSTGSACTGTEVVAGPASAAESVASCCGGGAWLAWAAAGTACAAESVAACGGGGAWLAACGGGGAWLAWAAAGTACAAECSAAPWSGGHSCSGLSPRPT